MRRRSRSLDSVNANVLQGTEDAVNTILELRIRFPDRSAKMSVCLYSDQKSIPVLSVLKMCREHHMPLMRAIADTFGDWTCDSAHIRASNAFAAKRVHRVYIDVADDENRAVWDEYFARLQ